MPSVSACMGDKLSKLSEKAPAQTKMPDPVVVSASAKHTGTLIFLHGLGDTGHGWATIIAAIRPPHIKVICPTANKMPVTLNSGKCKPHNQYEEKYEEKYEGKYDENISKNMRKNMSKNMSKNMTFKDFQGAL